MIYVALFTSETQRIRSQYNLPGLLTVNKQIHHEAIAMYYATSLFRCLDEDSTVYWLVRLPSRYRELIQEVRYDTRWIIFVRPYIPVPGAEGWLWLNLCRRLEAQGVDVEAFGKAGRLKISHYRAGEGGGDIVWTDRPGPMDDEA